MHNVHCGKLLCAFLCVKMADSDDSLEPNPSQDIVVTKYKMAGDMVNSMYHCYVNLFWHNFVCYICFVIKL